MAAILKRLVPSHDSVAEDMYRAASEGTLNARQTLAAGADRYSVGAELLEKLRQPVILIDNQRRITYRNQNAAGMLARREIVYDNDGALSCRNSESDLDLTLAICSMGTLPISAHGNQVAIQDRRAIRLKRKDGRMVAATIIALRPEATMRSFGRSPQVLFTVFEPGAPVEIDPFILSTTFDLTNAEARVAATLVGGGSPEQCAVEFNVKISTIRSQLVSIYRKTGATGQADLVRLILSATTL